MRRIPRQGTVFAATFIGASFLISGTMQSSPAASTRSGIYTDEQAKQGSASYAKNCASCHSADLSGEGQAPPLADEEFTGNWSGKTVDDLFEKIQDSMPGDRPGALSRTENADILAYILSVNKFPAGTSKLSSEAEVLKQIQFEGPVSK